MKQVAHIINNLDDLSEKATRMKLSKNDFLNVLREVTRSKILSIKEAHGIFDFVVKTLQDKAESASEEEEVDLDAAPQDYFEGFTFKYEDENLTRVSSFALVLQQQVSLVEMTSLLITPRLASVGSRES